MTPTTRVVYFPAAACLMACSALAYCCLADPGRPTSKDGSLARANISSAGASQADELVRRQPRFFVPNLGQWDHPARFVHCAGTASLFLEDRGWVLDLRRPDVEMPDPSDRSVDPAGRSRHWRPQSAGGVAVRMSFVGSNSRPKLIGEEKLPGHHNYFLGDDEGRWRTDVPRYESVRYENMYPGIDVRMRSANGHPEYDLLCEAGSDLSDVRVEVQGADGLTIDADGCLRIETALGPIRQPRPKTWERLRGGGRRSIECDYVLLGSARFGFTAKNRNDAELLVIDPGLLWSTFLGGSGFSSETDMAYAIDVDVRGVVTVAGFTGANNFPTTIGAYDRTHNGNTGPRPLDVFVSRLDPRKTGTAQLTYSTFLGGSSSDQGLALAVDSSGVITVAGNTESANFPTTANAFDTTFNGPSRLYGNDAFVSRLDPRLVGPAQLIYSTFLGGKGGDNISDFSISPAGVVTAAGGTQSSNFPTTANAFDTSFQGLSDGFVCRLDLSKVGAAQLVYSTFLGGSGYEGVRSMAVDIFGNVNVAGVASSKDFPTTIGAFDTTFSGGTVDGFVSRLDLGRVGSKQLTYSTYLGGSTEDLVTELSVDVIGVLTVAGLTRSANFPTTARAFDTTFNGGYRDSFVSRLNPTGLGKAQLEYSTFLGGSKTSRTVVGNDVLTGLAVGADGIVTVCGMTDAADFPTTQDAHSTTTNGAGDIFASRLDPRLVGPAQLIYSTFLGGSSTDFAEALAVDASGIVTIAGWTMATNTGKYPTTRGAYMLKSIGVFDTVVSRLDLGIPLYADVHQLPIRIGGAQRFTIGAGKAHANRLYWMFGSITGTVPGVNVLGVHVPLNPDLYTNVALSAVNTTVFTNFRGKLDANGRASASFNLPANVPLPSGFTFHHAYVVYDASGKIHMASNAVPLRLK
jgi:hypothetical protein